MRAINLQRWDSPLVLPPLTDLPFGGDEAVHTGIDGKLALGLRLVDAENSRRFSPSQAGSSQGQRKRHGRRGKHQRVFDLSMAGLSRLLQAGEINHHVQIGTSAPVPRLQQLAQQIRSHHHNQWAQQPATTTEKAAQGCRRFPSVAIQGLGLIRQASSQQRLEVLPLVGRGKLR